MYCVAVYTVYYSALEEKEKYCVLNLKPALLYIVQKKKKNNSELDDLGVIVARERRFMTPRIYKTMCRKIYIYVSFVREKMELRKHFSGYFVYIYCTCIYVVLCTHLFNDTSAAGWYRGVNI